MCPIFFEKTMNPYLLSNLHPEKKHLNGHSSLIKHNVTMNYTPLDSSFQCASFSEAKNGKMKRLGFSTSRLIYIATLNIGKVIRVIKVEVDKWYYRHSTSLDCDNSELRVRKKESLRSLFRFN
jgi:hypothetical protein